jgi:uncharacterized protein (UPF0335 family)
MANTKLVDALLIERAGYERRGLVERVKQVDSALRELGFDHKYMTDIETASVVVEVERAAMRSPNKKKV